MKKVLLIVIILLLVSSMTFGEMIDESYIGLIFDNFSKYTEEQKKENAELLDVLFSSNLGLDLLYSEVVRTKSKSLEAYGISETELRRNIDILKSWSVSDRKALLAAGVEGDLDTVYEINNRNKEVEVIIEKAAFLSMEMPIIKKYDERFEDIKTHWSKNHVTYLTERGIISGKSEASFAPNDNVKKSEIVTLVMNVVVQDETKLPDYSKDITDIDGGHWYDSFMQNAATLDIVQEDSNGQLEPNKLSTREEVVDILIKSIQAMNITIPASLKVYPTEFNDFSSVSNELKESMAIAINLGFISGKGNGNIAPSDLITRGETAVVIKKLYEYILSEI